MTSMFVSTLYRAVASGGRLFDWIWFWWLMICHNCHKFQMVWKFFAMFVYFNSLLSFFDENTKFNAENHGRFCTKAKIHWSMWMAGFYHLLIKKNLNLCSSSLYKRFQIKSYFIYWFFGGLDFRSLTFSVMFLSFFSFVDFWRFLSDSVQFKVLFKP